MSQSVEYDEEWDIDENTYILYEHVNTERTVEHHTDHSRDETYSVSDVVDESSRAAYFEVEYITAESDGTPNHDPQYYLEQLANQTGSLQEEYGLDPEMNGFDVTVSTDDERVIIKFRNFEA
jgi:hypothetical protein